MEKENLPLAVSLDEYSREQKTCGWDFATVTRRMSLYLACGDRGVSVNVPFDLGSFAGLEFERSCLDVSQEFIFGQRSSKHIAVHVIVRKELFQFFGILIQVGSREL